MNWIKKISLKTASYSNIVVIITAIIVHLLVIFQIIPFTWINGGCSATFSIGRQTSITSIGILLIMILINLWACELLPIRKFTIILKILLWVLFAFSIFGTLQQLFGTTFEKFSMSILCIINVIMYFRLAIEKR